MSSRPIRQKKYDPGKDPNLEKEILEDVKTTKDASEEVPSLKETKKRDKERVQFDFAPEALDRIDDMKDRIGATTRAEVIRQALRVLEWFITETASSFADWILILLPKFYDSPHRDIRTYLC